MVTLTINPNKGNHTKYFPHSGYLGLSPVVVSGTVQTRLEEDLQPIQASRLIVRIRCYEAIGTNSTSHSFNSNSKSSSNLKHFNHHHHPHQQQQQQQQYQKNLQQSNNNNNPSIINQFSNLSVLWQTEKTLWSASEDNLYEPLGDWDGSWKLVIPVDAVDLKRRSNNNSYLPYSDCAVGSITYKSWRSWWQVETVIYHEPAGVFGTKIMKSHGLYLINYREAEKYYCNSIEDSTTTIQSTTTTDRRIRYSITSPTSVCCGDEVTLKILIGTSNHHHHQQQQQQQQRQQQQSVSDQSDSYSCQSPRIDRTGLLAQQTPQPDVVFKRLQVSLVRQLAIEFFKSTNPNGLSSSSSTSILDRQPVQVTQPKPWRFRRFASASSKLPNISPPLPSSGSSPIITNGNTKSIAASTNSVNSKRQCTTYNTLITNTEGISQAIVLNHHAHQLPHPHSRERTIDANDQQQEKYDYEFLVKMKIPLLKSKSHYSIGETCKTNLATVSFSFQFKLSMKNQATNRLETIELSDLNVQLFSISRQEIKAALDHLRRSAAEHQNKKLMNSPSNFLPSFDPPPPSPTPESKEQEEVVVNHRHESLMDPFLALSNPPPTPGSKEIGANHFKKSMKSASDSLPDFDPPPASSRKAAVNNLNKNLAMPSRNCFWPSDTLLSPPPAAPAPKKTGLAVHHRVVNSELLAASHFSKANRLKNSPSSSPFRPS